MSKPYTFNYSAMVRLLASADSFEEMIDKFKAEVPAFCRAQIVERFEEIRLYRERYDRGNLRRAFDLNSKQVNNIVRLNSNKKVVRVKHWEV